MFSGLRQPVFPSFSRSALEACTDGFFYLLSCPRSVFHVDLSSSISLSNNILSLTSLRLFCSSTHFNPVLVTGLLRSSHFIFSALIFALFQNQGPTHFQVNKNIGLETYQIQNLRGELDALPVNGQALKQHFH
jgi:hypothetical protein